MVYSVTAYFEQGPIPTLIIAVVSLILLLINFFNKKTFSFPPFLLSVLTIFSSAMIIVFYADIVGLDNKQPSDLNDYIKYILLALDSIGLLQIFFIAYSIVNENKTSGVLSDALDGSKYYAVLDKNDNVRSMSTLMLEDFGIELKDAKGKNFFDVVECKYAILGLNGVESTTKEIKKEFSRLNQNSESLTSKFELNVQNDYGMNQSLFLNSHLLFNADKYKGRVIIGDKVNQEELLTLENKMNETQNELDVIKSRFVTLLSKTNDGIFFNDLTNKNIWFNDILVKKLSLNGNSVGSQEFYNNIHHDDMPIYKSIMTNLKGDEYSVTYRYNTGNYYVYVKEEGHKIIGKNFVELCGMMNVLDDFGYESTQTNLDKIYNEKDLFNKLREYQVTGDVFLGVYFKINSIPEINEKFGRAIGNNVILQYITFIKNNFVLDNQIYRVSGLEFFFLVTSFNKMELIKKKLNDQEKMLHAKFDYGTESASIDVTMGLSFSNDSTAVKDVVKNAKRAMKICQNPNFSASYAYYKDVR